MHHDNDRTVVNTGRMPLFGAAATTTTGMNAYHNDMGPSANVLPVGSILGEFEIVNLIGEGGFGIVYLALDHSLGRHVALKEYMPSGMASRTRNFEVTVRSQHQADTFNAGLKSFINEARLLAQFDSKSLVKVYRFWEANGTAYMVMPFYAGITLKQALKERRIIPTENWIKQMLTDLLEAVDTIHRVQCFHRDIAPDNILLLNEDGRPLLLDFGAARRVIGDRTQGPTVILKPGFAPIEQYADIGGLRQGAWTDIYALGAVVYYLISGKAPPPAVARIVNDEMTPAREVGKDRYSEGFLTVIDQALAVKPADRLQSVQELRRALGIPEPVPRTTSDGYAPGGNAFGTPSSFAPNYAPAGAAVQGHHYAEPDMAWLNKIASDKMPAQNTAPQKKRLSWALPALIAGAVGIAGISYWWLSLTEDPKTSQVITAESPAPTENDLSVLSETQSAPADASPLDALPPVASEADSGNGESMRAEAPSATIAAAPPMETTVPEQPPVAKAPPSRPVHKPVPARISPEDELWRIATTSDKPNAYEFYLNEYPKGRYASAAKAKLALSKPKNTEVKAAPAQEEQNQLASTPTAKSNAVTSPPVQDKAPVALSEASPKPQAIIRDAEDELWRLATNTNNPSDYETYLGKYPNGKNASAAKEKLAILRPPEKIERVPDMLPKDVPPLVTPKQQMDEPPLTGRQDAKPGASSRSKKVFAFNNQTMSGDFEVDSVTGAVSGAGKIVWTNGDVFEGTLVKGSKEGKGRFAWADGTRYSGDWVKDTPNGRGTFIFPNGDRYEGDVKNGKPDGMGIMKFKNGDSHQGNWLMGKSNGPGRYTWASGRYWEGEFDNGRKTENGKMVGLEQATDDASQAAIK